VVGAATDTAKSNQTMVPLAIGMAVTVAHFVAIPIDGTSLNPSRSFGIAVAASGLPGCNERVWPDHWIFWVGPIFGAVLGLVTYEVIFAVRSGKTGTLLEQYITPEALASMQLEGNQDLLSTVTSGDTGREGKVKTLNEARQTELAEYSLEQGAWLSRWYTRSLCFCACTGCLIWGVYGIIKHQVETNIQRKIDQLAVDQASDGPAAVGRKHEPIRERDNTHDLDVEMI